MLVNKKWVYLNKIIFKANKNFLKIFKFNTIKWIYIE